jgi:hypothetical protein
MIRSVITTALTTLLLFASVLYTGCFKDALDPCAKVTCQNGGTCSGGSCDCPTGYTGTYCEKRTCEVNETAEIYFKNNSLTHTTYYVLFDGLNYCTIAPGESSQKFTVAAGEHTLQFMQSNNNQAACSASSPNIAKCYSGYYNCSY